MTRQGRTSHNSHVFLPVWGVESRVKEEYLFNMSDFENRKSSSSKEELALPDARLCAVILDGLSLAVAIFASYYWFSNGLSIEVTQFNVGDNWYKFAPILILAAWQFASWEEGTTIGHSLFKQYIVNEKSGATFTLKKMILREFVNKFLLCGLLSAITFSIYFLVDSLMAVKDDRRTIHDRISGSLVVQR